MLIKSSDIKDTRYLSSQTPPDFSEDNYYLKTLQLKIDADWPYRPNRKWVEEERDSGSEVYHPIEVVIQTIKSDKGEAVSDDWYRLVFKDCQKRVRIGTRYRFAYEANINVPNPQKNIWIALNQTQLSPTATQTVCRCNGTIGSIYVDADGNQIRHYEPIIQPDKLSGAGVSNSEVAVDIRGGKMIIAQCNKYTQQYYINQRFFIDTNAYKREDQPVYKITSIMRSNTLTTYDPSDVGIIRIYYEVDQIGEKDDVENRIAYNGLYDDNISPESDVPSVPAIESTSDYYNFVISNPINLPNTLTDLTFTPELIGVDGPIVAPISVECKLDGAYYAPLVSINNYVGLTDNNDGTYTLKRLKTDTTLIVVVNCKAIAPNNSKYEISFEMRLSD